MFSLVLLCIFCCVFICYVWRAKKRAKYEHPLPPAYPGALPIIGHTHLLTSNLEKLLEIVKAASEDCVRQGGVTVFHLGQVLYYLVTDPQDVITAANGCLEKDFLYEFAKSWLGNGLATAPRDIWMRHRKLLVPAFSLRVINGFNKIFNSQGKQLVSDLSVHVGNGPFDATDICKKIAMETLCLTALGVNDLEKDFVKNYMKSLDKMWENLVRRAITSFYLQSEFIYKLSGFKKEDEDILRHLKTMSNEVITKKKQKMKQLSPYYDNLRENDTTPVRCKPFLDLLLDLYYSNALTESEVQDELDTILMVGFDSSSNVLGNIAVLLGTYPDTQEKIYQEIMEVLGKNRDVENNDLNTLVYTEAFIKEAIRYISFTPLLLRYVDKDLKLKNYTMRAGSHCAMLSYGTHRLECWGPDRAEFKPERWLDPDTLPKDSNAFGGFSWGKRNCIGKTYSMANLKINIVHLVRRYKITADITKIKHKTDFIVRPCTGFIIEIENRN